MLLLKANLIALTAKQTNELFFIHKSFEVKYAATFLQMLSKIVHQHHKLHIRRIFKEESLILSSTASIGEKRTLRYQFLFFIYLKICAECAGFLKSLRNLNILLLSKYPEKRLSSNMDNQIRTLIRATKTSAFLLLYYCPFSLFKFEKCTFIQKWFHVLNLCTAIICGLSAASPIRSPDYLYVLAYILIQTHCIGSFCLIILYTLGFALFIFNLLMTFERLINSKVQITFFLSQSLGFIIFTRLFTRILYANQLA